MPVNLHSKSFGVVIYAALGLLLVTAVALFAWPAYRASLDVYLDPNEGWNAYFADAAMGRMPLYPGPGLLVTNNYPPLSFYVEGGLGKIVGDNVLTGRLLSLAAVLGIAWAVGRIVLLLGGNRTGAAIGAVWFVGTMSRFYTGYVGMNDPQLLAHALMTLACAAFLRALMRGRDCTPAILGMVAAGFFKHNIIAMPLAAMFWLALHDRRQFWKCGGCALLAVAAGFAACRGLYGREFLLNFFTPRSYSWSDAFSALADLRFMVAGLVAWVSLYWLGFNGKYAQFCHLLAGLGLLTFFLEKSGSGVDVNAEFDLVIALSIILGTAFSRLFMLPHERPGICLTQLAAVLVLWAGWAVTPRLEIGRLVFDSSFRDTIIACEKAAADAIAQARAAKGNVLCDPLVCYRAGKPIFVDEFNTEERIRAGKLPKDAISRLVENGQLTEIDPGPDFYILNP